MDEIEHKEKKSLDYHTDAIAKEKGIGAKQQGECDSYGNVENIKIGIDAQDAAKAHRLSDGSGLVRVCSRSTHGTHNARHGECRIDGTPDERLHADSMEKRKPGKEQPATDEH